MDFHDGSDCNSQAAHGSKEPVVSVANVVPYVFTINQYPVESALEFRTVCIVSPKSFSSVLTFGQSREQPLECLLLLFPYYLF